MERSEKRNLILILMGSALLAFSFLLHFYNHNSAALMADAYEYQKIAKLFRSEGWLSAFGTTRTYAYPSFLALVSFGSGFDHRSLSVTAGAVQYVLFVASTLWLATLIRKCSKRLSWAVTVGLLLNPLLLGVVTDSLTEGLSLPLAIILLAVAILLEQRASTLTNLLAIMFSGTLISSLSLMVRPANLTLVVAWNLTLIFACWAKRNDWKRSGLLIGAHAAFFLVAGVVTWGPQVYYNSLHWGKATFLPICRLANLQFSYGVNLWKYDTITTDNGARGWFYINPLFKGTLPDKGALFWYVDHPIDGALTALMHVFSSFSVANFFTYISSPDPLYSIPLCFIVWICVALGSVRGASYLLHTRHLISNGILGSNYLATLLALSVFILTIGLNSLLAVEQRFNLIPIAIAVVMSIDWLFDHKNRPNWLLATAVVFVAIAGVLGNEWLKRLGAPISALAMPPFNYAANQCY